MSTHNTPSVLIHSRNAKQTSKQKLMMRVFLDVVPCSLV